MSSSPHRIARLGLLLIAFVVQVRQPAVTDVAAQCSNDAAHSTIVYTFENLDDQDKDGRRYLRDREKISLARVDSPGTLVAIGKVPEREDHWRATISDPNDKIYPSLHGLKAEVNYFELSEATGTSVRGSTFGLEETCVAYYSFVIKRQLWAVAVDSDPRELVVEYSVGSTVGTGKTKHIIEGLDLASELRMVIYVLENCGYEFRLSYDKLKRRNFELLDKRRDIAWKIAGEVLSALRRRGESEPGQDPSWLTNCLPEATVRDSTYQLDFVAGLIMNRASKLESVRVGHTWELD